MKTAQKIIMMAVALALLAATGCKQPYDYTMQRNRIFLLGRLVVGKTCDVRVIWRKAPEDAEPVTVTADLSQIGGDAAQALAATDNGTWRWAGQVDPGSAGEKTVTVTALDDQGAPEELRKNFRVFDTARAVAIAKDEDLSLAVKADGTVVAWDCPDYDPYQHNRGQCTVPEGITDAVAVAAGSGFGLALNGDGTITAWGEYESVASYNPYYVSSWKKMEVPEGLTDVVAVDAAHRNALAIKADGTMVVWGDNFYNQCAAPAGLTDIISAAAGDGYTLAARADGTIAAFGNIMPHSSENVLAVTAYSATTAFALHANGYAETFNDAYPLPRRLGGGFTAISSFEGTMGIGLRCDGTVTAWWGQGIVTEGLRNIVAIARTMALARDGSVISFAPELFGFKLLPVPDEVQ